LAAPQGAAGPVPLVPERFARGRVVRTVPMLMVGMLMITVLF